MKIDLNEIISATILIIGHTFFFLNVSQDIAYSVIAVLATFIGWIIWNKITDTLELSSLFLLIAISGIIISITTFLVYGVEPIGTRKGTLIHFHSTGIAVALGIFFIALIPYVIFNLKFKLPKPFNVTFTSGFQNKKPSVKKEATDKYVVGDANWELASEEEVSSGDYNIE